MVPGEHSSCAFGITRTASRTTLIPRRDCALLGPADVASVGTVVSGAVRSLFNRSFLWWTTPGPTPLTAVRRIGQVAVVVACRAVSLIRPSAWQLSSQVVEPFTPVISPVVNLN